MLSRPHNGWTEFKLEGTQSYGLSYLDDIAPEWLEQAIHGLETLLPFCVKGFLEPDRFLCVVSYYNCHITVETDDRRELGEDDISAECSHTSMLEFCGYLYEDISAYIDEWASFVDYCDNDCEKRKELLRKRLAQLKKLIEEKKIYWDNMHGFI